MLDVENCDLLSAVRVGMNVVKKYQGVSPELRVQLKTDDQTLVTRVDSESGLVIYAKLQKTLGDDVAYSMEDTATVQSDKRYVVLGDPLDGTGAFVNGLCTSTVILGIYDRQDKKLVACAIGEPATGRIWYTQDSSTVLYSLHGLNKCGVWTPGQEVKGRATVLLDVSHGFNRGERQMLTDGQMATLFGRLIPHVKLLLPGSNGLTHALVANGGELIAGAITTAIGGPWDICGVLLVLNAGGKAKAFRVEENRTLTEVDPLDVLAADLLVSGNTQETVDFLSEKLITCFD